MEQAARWLEVVVRAVPTDLPKLDEIMALVKRQDTAKQPKQANVNEFRRFLAQIPDLWQWSGNLAEINAARLPDKLVDQPGVRASVMEGCTVLRRALGSDCAPMLEQLLIEQSVLCHLRLQWCEYHLTKATGEFTPSWEQRTGAAQRRFIRASESLSRIRRLNISVPVNSATNGGQQVNAQEG